MSHNGYAYRAVEIIKGLHPKIQAQIEWLRINHIPNAKLSSINQVTTNFPDFEYKFTWIRGGFYLIYYKEISTNIVVVIDISNITRPS